MTKYLIKYQLFQRSGDGIYRFGPTLSAEWEGQSEDEAMDFLMSCYKPGEFSLVSISGGPNRDR